MKSINWLAAAMAALLPFAAWAQTSDADYCKALTQKYETYVSNMSVGRSAGSGTIDASVAISQCKDGKTAAAIPVLEQKLRDARIDLPPRG
jgi:hypothetical protein